MRTELIEAARAVCGEFTLREKWCFAGTVGAALRTRGGAIYTGISIDLGCGLGFCAEVAAIAEMLKNRETRIDTIVAVTPNRILPPCGRCRETMVQLDRANLRTKVIISETQNVLLGDLLPDHWLDGGTI
ncbi:MAG: cytidine deaminase [Proteobacteria bacterium]|nr:cytidine deaminase [Pseudomonadota bacterium]MBU4294677.1 cytidine deaminase [Pseudomonadota bacterium]MCG2748589.1 hypothetical protein [Desulfobulbaceae bacterium]